MATLREIRQKIRSIDNIKQITQAMELVAASRLRKEEAKAKNARPFAFKIKEILDRVISVTDQEEHHPLLIKREVKKIGALIIAGDRGLSGNYNQKIFQQAESFLQKYQKEQVELFLVGRKAVDFFKRKPWELVFQLEDWGGKISYTQIETYTKMFMDRYVEKIVDEIWMIFTYFVNVRRNEVRVEKFLPIELTTVDPVKSDILFEPDASTIFEKILPRYCAITLQSAFHNAYASELASRIFSMQLATQNAEKMGEKLTLERNKLRQFAITKELLEITTGAESIV